MHQPIFALLSTTIPGARTSILVGAGCCVVTLRAALLIAEIRERRKKVYAGLVRSVTYPRQATPAALPDQ